MFFRPANQVLFIDVANAAASSDARSELARQVPHRYCSELEDGLKLLRKNTANLVVLSGQDITEELSHQCSLIAGTRPQESLPVVLLLAEESGTHPELQLAGVVGVTTIQGTWQSTARQLAQIAELLTKIRRLKQDLRLSNLATKAFDIACCSIRSETGECTTDPAFPRLLGFHDNTTTSTGFHWSRLLEHLTEADRQRFEANVNQALTNGKEWFLELTPRARNYRLECKAFVSRAAAGSPSSVELIWHRVEQRANSVNQDGATDRSFSKQVARSIRSHPTGSVLLVRLENHADIQKSLGYITCRRVGNRLVSRLKSATRSSDAVLRADAYDDNVVYLEGSEILVILENLGEDEALAGVKKRVIQELHPPVELGERKVPIRCSIRSASWPADGIEADLLLNAASFSREAHAEEAAQSAADFESAREALKIEADLYDAIAKDEFLLNFQPKYLLGKNGKPVGAEALLRWHRNHEEWISPEIFIPLAEEIGLITDIGRWVIEETTRTQRTWVNEGVGLIPVSINVSAQQFRQPDFLQHLVSSCKDNDVPTEAVELEITESCLIDEPEKVVAILNEARAAGFSIALDDFGTGFSSLSYLRTLPLDVLKIDQSFVRPLDGESYDPSLTAAIIGIGLVLGLSIVAEGIETPEQWRLLRAWGCHQGQGYLMSKPVTHEVMADLMQKEINVASFG